METISSRELSEQSGATYRQIDYWCSNGVFSPINNNNPGSGQRRLFDKQTVAKVTVLANISNAFAVRHGLNCEFLKEVYDRYDKGFIMLGRNIKLSWELE